MPDKANPYASPAAYDLPLGTDSHGPGEFAGAMRKVQVGLSLIYYGIVGVVLAGIGIPLLFFVISGGDWAYTMRGTEYELALLALFGVVFFVGQVMCTFAPRASQARGVAVATIVLHLALLFGGPLIGEYLAPTAAASINWLAAILSIICFLFFLRNTSLYTGDTVVAGRAQRTMIVVVLSAVLLFLASLIDPSMGSGQAPGLVAGLLHLIGWITAFSAFVMYANTITYLRKAIKH